ncbi:MAG: sulfurtransferase-like selenium metabolism protein YedF [Desulfobacterales bacterium]|jgi:selenium metabolism protein YedF
MNKTLDARGLACPAPVLMTKDAVEKDKLDTVEVIIDNEAAKENVSRFLGSQQFSVTTVEEGNDYKICAQRQGYMMGTISKFENFPQPKASDQKQKIMVLIATDRLGNGDDELGKKLIISFIKTIKEMGDELWRLVLVNNGVKLTTDDSQVLEDLVAYENDGLTILVCGTCLTHFGLLEAKKVGETTNMLDIVTAMQLADKVINI